MKSVLWPNVPRIGGVGSAFHPMKIHICTRRGWVKVGEVSSLNKRQDFKRNFRADFYRRAPHTFKERI